MDAGSVIAPGPRIAGRMLSVAELLEQRVHPGASCLAVFDRLLDRRHRVRLLQLSDPGCRLVPASRP